MHPNIIVWSLTTYADLAIKINKIVYELWHNCSSYGHNIEHNRQLF